MSNTPKLLSARYMGSAETERSYFHVEVDADVSLQDILTPAFWGHHASRVKRGTLIDVIRRDLTLDVQLRVLETGKGFVKVRPIRVYEDEAAAAQIAETAARIEQINADDTVENEILPADFYKISHVARGAKAGFVVIYKPTDTRIAEAVALRPDAVRLALAHAKQLGIDLTPVPKAEEMVE